MALRTAPWPPPAPAGGTLVATIGPLELSGVPAATPALVQVNYRTTPAGGTVGATAGQAAHFHPGVESFYVLAGEQTIWTPGRAAHTSTGESWAGEPAGTPMIVVNTGPTERRAFTLYMGDAAQPWVQPTLFP